MDAGRGCLWRLGAHIKDAMFAATIIRQMGLCVAAVVAVAASRADTWVLANGDRLTGTLVQEDDTALHIEHAQLGRITIPRAGLQGQVSEEQTVADAAALAGGATGGETPAARTRERTQWARQVEFGFVHHEGAKSVREFTARAQVEARRGANSYRGSARLLRAETEGVATVDREEADFRWRRDFNRRLFAQALTTYAADDLRRIDLSIEQQIGGGYRIIDGERQKMNLGVGAVVQRLARDGLDDYTALLGSAFQDYTFSWNDRFKLLQEATVLFADDVSMSALGGQSTVANAPSGDNYRLKFNTTLQSRMTEQISLNLRFEYDYDRSIPDRTFRSDSRLTTSLGYSW